MGLVRTDISDELSSSFIRVTRIGELGTTLAVTINRRNLMYAHYIQQEVMRLSMRSTSATLALLWTLCREGSGAVL
jgi:hypothetical protein